MSKQRERRLGIGTQTIRMLDITEVRCHCGRRLYWTTGSDDPEVANEALCSCGMQYTAWQAEIKVEGVDRNHD